MASQLHSYLDTIGKDAENLGIVLERYQPQVSSTNEAFSLFLKRNKLSEQFIENLSLAFEQPDSFNAADFEMFSIPVILDYLKKTHQHYRSYYFSKIDRSVENLYHMYPEAEELLDLLKIFFSDYQKDINAHIAEEEEKLFPYIYQMICLPSSEFKKRNNTNYDIAQFKKDHDQENEDALLNILQMIKQRYPAAGFSPLNILLMQIRMFEKDLRIHSKIEDEVLLPKAEKLERLISKR